MNKAHTSAILKGLLDMTDEYRGCSEMDSSRFNMLITIMFNIIQGMAEGEDYLAMNEEMVWYYLKPDRKKPRMDEVRWLINIHAHKNSRIEMCNKAQTLIYDILLELSAGHDFEIPEFVSRTKQQALNSLPQTEQSNDKFY